MVIRMSVGALKLLTKYWEVFGVIFGRESPILTKSHPKYKTPGCAGYIDVSVWHLKLLQRETYVFA
jgi:hypothetical protein